METWEVLNIKEGEIVRDWFDEGVRALVMRGPAALCAYLGVPEKHPLAGWNYDDLPLSVHGGLTFGCLGKEPWPTGFYFYGWDYAHAGDACVYDYRPGVLPLSSYKLNDKKWTVAEVEAEVKEAIWDFKKLMKLSEQIANRYQWGNKDA